MNVENINKLADTLEEVHKINKNLFDMGNWGDEMWLNVLRNMGINPVDYRYEASEEEDATVIKADDRIEHCGTSGCIAGWAILVLGDGPPGTRSMSDYAADLLGLDDDRIAGNLFTPGSEQLGYLGYQDINAGMAAEVLRELAQTGEANWSLVGGAYDDDEEEEDEEDEEVDEE